MVKRVEVSICSPPHREKHVAEIAVWTDEVVQAGTDGSWYGIGEVAVDSGVLEFHFYPSGDESVPAISVDQLIHALSEGKRRLLEIYPELESIEKV